MLVSGWSSRGDGKCGNCGFSVHKGSTCPASTQTCRKCGRIGHYARCCRSKKQSQIQEVDCGNEQGVELETVRINVVGGQSSTLEYRQCVCELAGVSLSLVIDLGAKVSVLSKRSYDRWFSWSKLEPANRKLVGYAGSPIKVLGKAKLPVRYRRCQLAEFPFYITDKGTDILGLDLFDALGFQICWDPEELGSHSVQAVDLLNDGVTKGGWSRRWPRVFSGLGKANHFVHCPLVNTTVPPIMQPLRRLSLALRERVAEELDRWESLDIIEKVDSSPWISNLVVVWKKSGAIRLCVDLRRANQAIIPGKHPLPTMEDIAAEFYGSTVFSKLDLNQGYLQIPLAEESRFITAFVTHKGTYQFKRMPFGLASAPSAFQKVMVTVVAGIPGVAVYMDDIVVHGPDRPSHNKRLNDVFQRLQHHNLTLNVDKCTFAVKEISFVGHSISASGIRPLTSNIEAVERLKEPTSVTELNSFLGMTNYYLRFVQGYADISSPLRCLLRKDAHWEWSTECQTAFDKLKQLVTSAPVLAHFSSTADTFVSCDASGVAIGAVLSQIQDGQERPVAYASRALSPAEQKYAVGEREALACVWACEKWHVFLFGRPFVLRTDHQALVSLLSASGTGQRPLRLHRWTERLYKYTFRVEYRPGHSNQVADLLSRSPAPAENSAWDSDDVEECILLLSTWSPGVPLDEMERESGADAEIQTVLRCIREGWHDVKGEFRPFWNVRHELAPVGGKSSCLMRGNRIVVPRLLQKRVLQLAHEGHLGVVRMKQRCREFAWWPGIDRQIEQMVRDCEPCLVSGKSRQPVHAPLQPTPWTAVPWQRLQVDIFGEIQIAMAHQRYAILVHDLGSKWPEVRLCSQVRTQEVVQFLEDLIVRWGFPESITTDNGPQFRSYEFQQWLRERGIRHILTPLYHPKANGGVERFNQVLKQGLKTGLLEGRSVESSVQSTLFNYRSTAHSLTRKSPAEVMLGRKLRQPLSQMIPRQDKKGSLQLKNADEVVARKQAAMKAYVDHKRRARASSFSPGSWVRVKRPLRGHKLKSQLSDPVEVWSRVGKDTYLLQDGRLWHADQLIAVAKPAGVANTAAVLSWTEGEEEISEDMTGNQHDGGNVEVEGEAASDAGTAHDHENETETTRPKRVRTRPKRFEDFEVEYATRLEGGENVVFVDAC